MFDQTTVFPAPAGINRSSRYKILCQISVPRASGDKPVYPSPHNSGYTVFPAPAGINRFVERTHVGGDCVPRASGDKPPFGDTIQEIAACSPRQRG
ncbi:TPA: hypothetical protein HIF43_000162 [Escherichia coli]|nr:hypothetical protein [Escherichia coli]